LAEEKATVAVKTSVEIVRETENQTLDKETNTECIFIPEQGKQRKLSAAGIIPGAVHDDKNSIVIKRSQTFSPSAAVSRNNYICRVSVFLYIVF
jgi:protein KIBRA